MSLESLFLSPDRLIRRFQHPTVFSRAMWVYLLMTILILGLLMALYVQSVAVILIAGLVVIFYWFFNNLYDAYLLSKAMLIDRNAFPDLYQRVYDIKKTLNYCRPLKIHITKRAAEVKITSIFGRKRLMIGIDMLRKGVGEREVDFMIARAITIYKMKEIYLSLFASILDEMERIIIFNPFLYTFERALELSADRIASLFSGSPEYCMKMIRFSMMGLSALELNEFGLENTDKFQESFWDWLMYAFTKKPSPLKRMLEIEKFYENYKILFVKRHESDGYKNTRQPIMIEFN